MSDYKAPLFNLNRGDHPGWAHNSAANALGRVNPNDYASEYECQQAIIRKSLEVVQELNDNALRLIAEITEALQEISAKR